MANTTCSDPQVRPSSLQAHSLMVVRNSKSAISRNQDVADDDSSSSSEWILHKLEKGHHSDKAMALPALELIDYYQTPEYPTGWHAFLRVTASILFGEHPREHLREMAHRAIMRDQDLAGRIAMTARARKVWGGARSPRLTKEGEMWIKDQMQKKEEAESTTDEAIQEIYARDPEKFVRLAVARNRNINPRIARKMLGMDDISVDNALFRNTSVSDEVHNEIAIRRRYKKLN